MQIVPFVARTAAEAFARIQDQMGPEAVVLNVRQLPVSGLARFWRRPRIEVLACPPGLFREPAGSASAEPLPELAPRFPLAPLPANPTDPMAPPVLEAGGASLGPGVRPSRWRVAELLSAAGIQPLAAQRLIDDIETHHGPQPPATMHREIAFLRETLRQLWMVADPIQKTRPQVLVGPSGSGKTTLLCKWLTKLVLMEGESARVFRMDANTANTAETLDVHG